MCVIYSMVVNWTINMRVFIWCRHQYATLSRLHAFLLFNFETHRKRRCLVVLFT